VAVKELDFHHQQLVVWVSLQFPGHGLWLDAGARLIDQAASILLPQVEF
jgi:hypothetical protein